MPYLNIKLTAPNSHEGKEKVAAMLTELTAIVLGKKKELIAGSIECYR
jgi:phenylpyruvate tautomerase PptA (4-oxalocrotonate tautomerase family)